MSENPVHEHTHSGLAGILNAKIGKVRIVYVGIPLVLLAAFGSRFLGKKTAVDASSGGDPGSDAQPVFIAKSPPGNWLALDQTTGKATASDGTVFAPVDAGNGATAFPTVDAPPPSNAIPPQTPNPVVGDPGPIIVAPAPTTPNAPPTSVPSPVTSPVTPAPTPTTAKPATSVTYRKITAGDNWNTVAAGHNLTVAQLEALNPERKGAALKANGSTLRVS